MLKGLVAWVLNRYIGKYFEDFNTEQLSFAIFEGNLNLENLPLKRTNLEHLGLPLAIRNGFLGKANIKVPVSRFRSEPWILSFEQLYVVLGPLLTSDFDPDAEEMFLLEQKLAELDKMEMKWRSFNEPSTSQYNNSYTSWVSYGTNLVTGIIENLQVVIKDVHIRYEDSESIPNVPFAFGTTIERLSAQTCNDQWVPEFVTGSTKHSFKLVEVQKMAFYWDTQAEMYGQRSHGSLATAMLNPLAQALHQYVISPVSGVAKVKRNQSERPLKSTNTPRYTCDFTMEAFNLALNEVQYSQIVQCTRSLRQLERKRRRCRWRLPPESCTARERWKYAIDSVLEPIRQRFKYRNWPAALRRAADCILYVEIYERHLKDPATLPPIDRKEKERIEAEFGLLELQALREVVMDSLEVSKPRDESVSEDSGLTFLQRWFPSWSGWYYGDSGSKTSDKTRDTSQFEEELFDTLKDSYENDNVLRRDAVFGHFNFNLLKGTIKLVSASDEKKRLVELQFEQLLLKSESRPRYGSFRVQLTLGSVFLIDCDSGVPCILPQNREKYEQFSAVGDRTLFSVDFEKKPLNASVDFRLHLNSNGLECHYKRSLLKVVKEFFVVSDVELGDFDSESLEAMKERTKRELKNIRDKLEQKLWDINIDIVAPQLILDENEAGTENLILIDFGRLRMSNFARPSFPPKAPIVTDDDSDDEFITPCSTPEETPQEDRHDKFMLDLTDMQILIGKSSESWRLYRTRGTSPLHIVDRFSIFLRIERSISACGDITNPLFTVSGSLPRLVFRMSEKKIRTIVNILKAVRLDRSHQLPATSPSSLEACSNPDLRLVVALFNVETVLIHLQYETMPIAEVQVTGVRLAFTKRPFDTFTSLTVHSLLVVDAMQTFGPDFELLVASHRKVYMDSVSGSIRDSEPCSPQSPSSPDLSRGHHRATSPVSLSKALDRLKDGEGMYRGSTSPVLLDTGHLPLSRVNSGGLPCDTDLDSEALISFEYTEISPLCPTNELSEDIKIANLQFSSLDLIANQDTIFQIVAFLSSVFSGQGSEVARSQHNETVEQYEEGDNVPKFQLTFDFRRLNVLLLRSMRGTESSIGRKVGTVTISGAQIRAEFAEAIEVEGSLGGLQFLDLTSEGQLHQRVLSVGADPLVETHILGANMYQTINETKALTFQFQKRAPEVSLNLHLASVIYVHSPGFLHEVSLCAGQFRRHMSQFARNLKKAAANVAYDLAQRGTEALSDFTRSRNFARSRTESFAIIDDSVLDDDLNLGQKVLCSLSVVLETPIIVLPRFARSPEVLVSHLGRISLRNAKFKCKNSDTVPTYGMRRSSTVLELAPEAANDKIEVEIKNINVYSLDLTHRLNLAKISTVSEFYRCSSEQQKIVEDAAIQLTIQRCRNLGMNYPNEVMFPSGNVQCKTLLNVSGGFITPLKVSLNRQQYQQFIETLVYATAAVGESDVSSNPSGTLGSPKFQGPAEETNAPVLAMEGDFKLDEVTVDILSEGRPIVKLACNDIVMEYDKLAYLTEMQFSVKTITLEDLTLPEDSRHRFLFKSTSGEDKSAPYEYPFYVSTSCPELAPMGRLLHHSTSLPDKLQNECYGPEQKRLAFQSMKTKKAVPSTPPSSPCPEERRTSKVVSISCRFVDSKDPEFVNKYTSISTFLDVDFNSCDIVINLNSWVLLLDFFNSERPAVPQSAPKPSPSKNFSNVKSTFEVKTINLLLNRNAKEIALVKISEVFVEKEVRDKDTNVTGKLGKLAVYDLTPKGRLYREKFLTSGPEALDFQYFMFDPENSSVHSYDARLRLRMSAVVIVHVHQFFQEILAFIGDFGRLRILAAAARSGPIQATRGLRLLLDIETGSPVIVFPVSSRSEDVIVADLGGMVITNKFVRSDEREGNESLIPMLKQYMSKGVGQSEYSRAGSAVLLDTMSIVLKNMETYPARRKPRLDSNGIVLETIQVVKSGNSFVQQPCHLILIVERNLERHVSRHVPDLSVQGCLSEVHATIDPEQYKIIKSFLIHNLGEPFIDDSSPAASTAEIAVDESSDKKEAGEVGVSLFIRVDLVGVIIDLQASDPKKKLGSILFTRSYLLIELHGDGSKDIDLFSQKISLLDTRYDDAPKNAKLNVFRTILESFAEVEPTKNLQVEVHYRTTMDVTKFTVVLNRMRVMAIMDWWIIFLDFVMQPVENLREVVIEEAIPSQPLPRQAGVVNRAELATKIPFEMKLNITDSEIVVVEDSSLLETIAVILRGTAVLKYWPHLHAKPLSCNISKLEVYSCILSDEIATSLSIIDPVTASLEVRATLPITPAGLSDLTDFNPPRTLDIVVQPLCVRLSYSDMTVFKRIVESLPRQARRASAEKTVIETVPVNMQELVLQLVDMGFEPERSYIALKENKGSVELAALWLCDQKDGCDEPVRKKFEFFDSIEFKCSCLSLVLIDDTSDADIPLLDMSMLDLLLNRSLNFRLGTSAKFKFSVDFYNRALSGWEPLVEPWEVAVATREVKTEQGGYVIYEVKSEATLDMNITSDLLELEEAIRESWIEVRKAECSTAFKRRSPFVPYAIHNATGCSLLFATNILMSDSTSSVKTPANWIPVAAGETRAFSFEGRGRARLRDNRRVASASNQLFIEIDGWKTVGPITVDKVGHFYRHMYHQELGRAGRLIVEVSLEGSARKLITVRSSLMVMNGLHDTVEINLDAVTGCVKVKIPPRTSYPLPLDLIWSNIRVRPLANKNPSPYMFSAQPISWSSAARSKEVREMTVHCVSTTSNAEPSYRIFVRVRKEDFPEPPAISRALSTSNLTSIDCVKAALPIHSINLIPPLIVINLLPVDLGWKVGTVADGRIRSGKETSIHTVDFSSDVEIVFGLDGFVQKGVLLVPAERIDSVKRLCFLDSNSRRLFLQAKISCSSLAAFEITVFAPYWIINNSGLPLIFRQEGCEYDAAGQEDEHERAQCRMPLMFSFTDSDASVNLIARLGNQLHPSALTEWCNYFPLSENVRVRRLVARRSDGRPDLIYLVGVTVRPGKGRYRDSLIVKIAPRFEVHNFSKNRLIIGQKSVIETQCDLPDDQCHLTVMPESSVIFHWPRLDKEQLLCVKMPDLKDSRWSGGFQIEQIQSCHISIYDGDGISHFLHVEVSLQGPTYCVVFTDGESMPPLYRIDNWSEVPISCYQTGTSESTKSIIKAKSSIPYAWAEPTLPHYLTCEAPGGSSCSYYLDKFGELQKNLEYENFIYIAFSATFPRDISPTMTSRTTVSHPQLVLEVPSGTNRVKLAPKKHGERSQFWRMTADGRLEHEGSAPPSDPKSKFARKDPAMVLDVEAPALQPCQYTNLVIRKADPRRSNTQSWYLKDGRLRCSYSNLYVQPKDGADNLRPWADVVIGPSQPVTRYYKGDLPAEQAVEFQKYRPGSGSLCARVMADGPTRVLVLTDMQALYGRMEAKPKESPQPFLGKHVKIQFDLLGGIGLDLISGSPREELVYCKLSGISGSASIGPENQLTFEVEDVQVENMLKESENPLVLYVSNREQQTVAKAINFSAMHVPCPNVNANIFKYVYLSMQSMSLNVEEELLFKLLLFFGFDQSDIELERCNENDLDRTRAKLSAAGVQLKRHYVNSLRMELNDLRLSYLTASRLPAKLSRLKRQLGFKLLTRFENAELRLTPFEREHVFETASFLLESVKKHYVEEIVSQAVKIFGSCDIFGAPLGFVQDFQEGMVNLVVDGDVEGLFRNLAHGISNSTAKVTGSLSETLGAVTMDIHFEEERRRRLRGFSGSSTDRLLAGWEGFKHGFFGGVTSLVQQTYEGAVTEGFTGAFVGLGRGIIGTVAKPTIGMLDLAAGAAAAIRNSSRSETHGHPKLNRLQRLLHGPGGLLPKYKHSQALGQKILYQLNSNDYDETFLNLMTINSDKNPLCLLLSDRHLRIFSISEVGRTLLKQVELSSVNSVVHSGRNSVEVGVLRLTDGSVSPPGESGFTINCQQEMAKEIVREISYARGVYEENRHRLTRVSKHIGEQES